MSGKDEKKHPVLSSGCKRKHDGPPCPTKCNISNDVSNKRQKCTLAFAANLQITKIPRSENLATQRKFKYSQDELAALVTVVVQQVEGAKDALRLYLNDNVCLQKDARVRGVVFSALLKHANLKKHEYIVDICYNKDDEESSQSTQPLEENPCDTSCVCFKVKLYAYVQVFSSLDDVLEAMDAALLYSTPGSIVSSQEEKEESSQQDRQKNGQKRQDVREEKLTFAYRLIKKKTLGPTTTISVPMPSDQPTKTKSRQIFATEDEAIAFATSMADKKEKRRLFFEKAGASS